MPRAAGKVAQADIERYIRALSKSCGPVGVFIRPDGTVEIRPVEEQKPGRVDRQENLVP